MDAVEGTHTPPQNDVWTSILEKKEVNCDAPPYVHPLVKRSSSSLSKQSLEVCTESLGSETGSDGFSSYPPSETSDVDEEESTETTKVVTSAYRRKDPPCRARSFPPPLPSISKENGKSLYVRPSRNDGRLVLEAVSVTEQSNFRAHRQDGRLVLTFLEDPPTHELLEESESKLSVLINKPVVLSNRTPTWSNKISEVVLFGEAGQEEDAVRYSHGLTRGSPASPYNVYEYFWRVKPISLNPKSTLIIKNYTHYQSIVSNEPSSNRDDDSVLVGVESIVPLMRSCHEKRSALILLESPCIA